jgi:ubiquinone/menaquinone biosynthesis C-methylase UbiE
VSETGFKPHPFFARMWIREAARSEGHGAAEHRDEMLAGLSGRVLELGAGSGTNFAHYPPEVTEVLAVEPEPTLRKAAEEAAAAAPVPVRVVDGIADRLPAEDASVDAAVASLVLCSVPDQAVALAELRRVIRPGGELRFYEHVQAESQPMASVLAFAEKTFWPIVGAGCHPARHTGAAIETAGFELEDWRRFRWSPGFPLPKIPHIVGRARRP